MATPTSPLSDWSQAPEAWQSYAKTIPQLENMPDNAYDALREKYFQEQVLPSMMKQGANYSPEASKQAFFEKTERPSRLPHSLEAAKTAASLLANQAAKAFVAPFAGTNAWDAQKMQIALERRGQGLESEATREWMSPTLPKVAGELVGQAPFWMAGMEGVGAAAKAAKVSPAAARLFNIGAGGIIQGSYDAAKAQDGHRLVEGVGGAAMGAAGVAAFEGLGAFLRGKGMTPEEADAVVATTKGSAAPKEEAMAASAAASSPNLTADINSWLADQIKVADRNGVPKGATIAEPNARVKIQMTGADGAPYNVGGAVGIKLGDLPAVVGRIAQHLEKGGSITSVSGDVPELHSLLRQFEALNKVRGEYDLSVPLKGQAESVVPTEGVVAPASQPSSLEDLETQAWNAVGSKQVTSPRSLQNAAPQLRLNNKVAKQLFDRMYPEVDESAAASQLKSSPQSSAGEGVAPVEPPGTPSPGEAPGAALVAEKQLSELRSYIEPEEMPHLDKLEVLPSGRVRNKVDGSIYKNVAEAIQAEPKAVQGKFAAEERGGVKYRLWVKYAKGDTSLVASSANVAELESIARQEMSKWSDPKLNATDYRIMPADTPYKDIWPDVQPKLAAEEGGSRREFLKKAGGAAAAGAMRTPEQLAAALKSAEAGNKVAADLLNSLLEETSSKLLGFGKGFIKLQDYNDKAVFRTPSGVFDMIAGGGGADETGLLGTIRDWSKLPQEARASVVEELRSMTLYDFSHLAHDMENSDVYLPEDFEHLDKILPGFKRLVASLEDAPRFSSTEATKVSEALANPEKVDSVIAETRKVEADWSYREAQKVARPTGMELARTPLGLGEEGEGGVLTRFAGELEGSGRREFLKRAGGAAASLPLAQAKSLVSAASEGGAGALSLLQTLLSKVGYGDLKIINSGKGFFELEDSTGQRYFRSIDGISEELGNWGAIPFAELGRLGSKLSPKHLDMLLSEIKGRSRLGAINDAANIAGMDLPEIEKFLPGFSKLHPKLVDIWREMHAGSSIRGVADALPDKPFAAPRETSAALDTARAGQLEQVIRPTGKELARTPLGLGEAGEGGVLTRYGTSGEVEGKTFWPKGGGNAAWVSPKGKVHTFSGFEEHEATISDYLPAKEAKAYESSFGDTSDADQALSSVMAKGWVKIRDNTVSVSRQALDQPSLAKAMQVASEQSKSQDKAVYVTVRGLPEVRVRGADIGEFLSNPIKYIKTQPSGYGTNPNAPTTPTPGGWSFKETPQVSRLYGPGMTVEQTARASGAPTSMVDQLQGAAGAKGVTYPGSVTASGKPLVVLTEPSRGLIFHEMTHAHILATGLSDNVDAAIGSVKPAMIDALQGAFSPELKQMYGGRINAEELYTYSATAVRTDDQAAIVKFANADGGEEEFLDWVGQTTNKLKEEVAATPDSLHRRVFERKLDEVNRRASSYIQDIQNGTFNVDGLSLSWERGKFIAETSDGQAHTFANRTQLAEWLDRNHNEPLNAPSAVDESSLPKGTPRYAADLPGFTNKKPPIHTDPPSPGLSEREPARGGMMLTWRFFQPFQDWIDIVARKNKWPELSDLFGGKLQGAVENVENHIYDNQKMLKSTLGQFPPKRQSDLYTYLKASEADRPQVAKEFHFTGSEENAIKEFETKASGLADSYGSSLHNFVRSIAPSLRAKGYDLDTLVAGPSTSKEDVAFWKPLLEAGRVDPNDTNLLRLADGWVKGGARKIYLNDTIKEAEKFLSQRNVEGDRLVGDLRGALQRHLDFIKGMPDQSQQVVNAALGHVTELVNAGISKVNGKLPERFQIEPIDSIPQDILGKWVMYSYAGTIGLRPAIPIRAAMQMFITGYPILGGKYLAKGMGRMFPAIGEGTASEAYQVADRYGWLLKPRDYGNLYTGEGNIEQSVTAKLAQRSLQPLLWGHNAARLAVGWGHVERFMDALRYKSDPDAFLSKSSLNWLPTFKQRSYLREVQSLGTRDASDLAYRAAKDLVDVSQWNYRRGANPGLYEYGLGRLFGQYGTWPLNYIEFARKLATHPDKGTQIASLARLVLAHGAILKAGEAAGVDTGQWVFSQPMAYGGGPLFQAVRAVPGSLDFETQKGADARRELIRPLWPVPIFVPGGMAAQQLIDAINSNSPDIYKILMGFKPLKAGEELKGEHGLLP